MLTGSQHRDPSPNYGVALTHAACLAQPAARPVWLQLRLYERRRPFMMCGALDALIVDTDGAELFAVRTAIGSYWVRGRNARLCSGDGGCACEVAEVAEPA